MTSSSDITAPIRRVEPPQLSHDDALRYANIVTAAEDDPAHAGLSRLAWAYLRLSQQHQRLALRVENLLVPADDLELLLADMHRPSFRNDFPQVYGALVRIMSAQRED